MRRTFLHLRPGMPVAPRSVLSLVLTGKGPDQGKPVARRGRKARSLASCETVRLPEHKPETDGTTHTPEASL